MLGVRIFRNNQITSEEFLSSNLIISLYLFKLLLGCYQKISTIFHWKIITIAVKIFYSQQLKFHTRYAKYLLQIIKNYRKHSFLNIVIQINNMKCKNHSSMVNIGTGKAGKLLLGNKNITTRCHWLFAYFIINYLIMHLFITQNVIEKLYRCYKQIK